MRFSDLRGKFGILVCRNIEDRERVVKRCKNAAIDGHGLVVVLDDADLKLLVTEISEDFMQEYKFSRIQELFDELIH